MYKKILANANVEMYEGEGKVFDTHTVELTTPDGEVKHFTAKHILIATGGQAVLLNIPGKASYFCSLHANFLANRWSSFSTSNGSRFVPGILSSAWH